MESLRVLFWGPHILKFLLMIFTRTFNFKRFHMLTIQVFLLGTGNDLDCVNNLGAIALTQAKVWFRTNNLFLNENKTQRIIFSTSNDLTDSTKLLGIMIDSSLNWKKHVEYVSTKLARITYLMRNLRYIMPLSNLIQIYFSLFESHIRYGLFLWGNCTKIDIILKQQKAILRIFNNSNARESCRPLLKKLWCIDWDQSLAYIIRCNIVCSKKCVSI